MSGYDLTKKQEANGTLPKAKLEWIVSILEEIAGGKTLMQLHREGTVDYRNFYKIVVEYPEVAKAFGIAREMSGYSMEDMALDEAAKLVAPNNYSGTKVKAVQVAMDQWRWSAARRNQKEFGSTATTSLVVPIQIVTSLDIGQPGAKVEVQNDNVYEFAAEARTAAVDVEVEEVDGVVISAYTSPDEPVPGAGRFGITEPPKSVLPKNKGGRPPGKGKWRTPAGTAIAKAKRGVKRKVPSDGGTSSGE